MAKKYTQPPPDKRYELAIQNRLAGDSYHSSLLKAGFSPSFIPRYGIRKLKRLIASRMQDILDDYKQETVANLATLGEAERKAVAALANGDGWKELPKFASMSKQIKQVAGIMAPDSQPSQTLIQIAVLEVLIQQSVPSLAPPRSVPMIENKEQVGYRVGKQKDMNDKPSKHKVL